MAQRRMFSLDVCGTDNFLDLPASSQCLYFHLGLRADDDGFCGNPRTVTAMVNCSTDDLKLLIAKGYVIGFESGVIVIRHWNQNNYLRQDRYHETQYTDEKSMLIKNQNGSYDMVSADGRQLVYQTSTNGIPNSDKRYTEYSIDKYSIDKTSVAEERKTEQRGGENYGRKKRPSIYDDL